MKPEAETLPAHRQSDSHRLYFHHTWRSLPLPRLSEVRKMEEPPPLLVTDAEQCAILFTRLLKDCLQGPAGTKLRNSLRCGFILGLLEVLHSQLNTLLYTVWLPVACGGLIVLVCVNLLQAELFLF